MVLSYETVSSARGVVYSQSFAGYHIPPKLQSRIPFEKTEGLASFYLARHEDRGRLLWFAKILVEKQSPRPRRSGEPRPPDSRLFFEATVGSESDEVGAPITYTATEHRATYFQVEVGPEGRKGPAELLCRKVFFVDLYTYWPGGALRQRKLVRNDESFSVWEYDERGDLVSQVVEPSGGFSSSELSLQR